MCAALGSWYVQAADGSLAISDLPVKCQRVSQHCWLACKSEHVYLVPWAKQHSFVPPLHSSACLRHASWAADAWGTLIKL